MDLKLPSLSKHDGMNNGRDANDKPRKIYDYFSTVITRSQIDLILKVVKDERFLFFIKYGVLRRYDGECEIIYLEIPQIPKKLVVYRRPCTRVKSWDKFDLSQKDLPHIPLFEGEENLKYLFLQQNYISKIDQLVSLKEWTYLNWYGNKISEIENLDNWYKLKVLLLGKNNIVKIKNLHFLQHWEILDWHSNKIKQIENLGQWRRWKTLNLANNQITSLSELIFNKAWEELNIRKNWIGFIPNLTDKWEKMRKMNWGKNWIAKTEFLVELKKLKHLVELVWENNPVLFVKEANEMLIGLPVLVPEQLGISVNRENKGGGVNNSKNNKIYNKIIVHKRSWQNLGVSSKSPLSQSTAENISQLSSKSLKTKTGNSLGSQTSSIFKSQILVRPNKNKCPPISKDITPNIQKISYTPTSNPTKSIVKNESNVTASTIVNDSQVESSTNLEIQNSELNEAQSLKIIMPIQLAWMNEWKKIQKSGYDGYNNKKYKDISLTNGHIEIDNYSKWVVFGDSIKILYCEEFQSKITSISFNYYYYDIITSKKNLDNWLRFQTLKSIKFSDNNWFTFYQLLKWEAISSIDTLIIENNEVCDSVFLLKYFLVYRIQNLKYVNNNEITENDVVTSKVCFEEFDRCISYSEIKDETRKQENEAEEVIVDFPNEENEGNKMKESWNYFQFIKENWGIVLKEIIYELKKSEEE